MTRAHFTFIWSLPKEGFECTDGISLDLHYAPEDKVDGLERFLIYRYQGRSEPVMKQCRSFDLEEKSSLYMKFTKLDLTEESIIDFADKYGFLDSPQEISAPFQWPRFNPRGERLQFWEKEILEMKNAVNIWQASGEKNYDLDYLKKCISFEKKDFSMRYYTWCIPDEEIPNREGYARNRAVSFPIPQWCNDDDFMIIALCLLDNLINTKLENNKLAPRLKFSENPVKKNPNRLEICFQSTNLIGALWLQLARAIDASQELRRCIMCPNWFEIGSLQGTSRRDKLFCSDRCRKKASRLRKETKQLLKDGEGINTIAKSINIPTDTLTLLLSRGKN